MAFDTTVPQEYYDENFIPGTTNILTGKTTIDESSSITTQNH